MDDELRCWVGFSVFPGIGPVRFSLLRSYFGSAKAAWTASTSDLRGSMLGDRLVRQFDTFRKTFDLDAYLCALERAHVSVLPLTDARYPVLLSQISDAPFLLYIKSSSKKIDLGRVIGIVGTRKITRYGDEVTQSLTRALVAQGFVIVSGLAYGVDTVAHTTTLESHGKTIAVLGCGIDIIAPPSNARLYQEIVEQGAVVSEMPLGLRPGKGLFPARNRIISGLSHGIVVTEGAEDSGALITARYALEQGRDVFAVPGPITSPYSKGPAKLLKAGATLVESVDDILDALGLTNRTQGRETGEVCRESLTPDEQKIVSCLTRERMHIDALVVRANLTIPVLTATLTVLELKGIVKDYGEKEYGLV